MAIIQSFRHNNSEYHTDTNQSQCSITESNLRGKSRNKTSTADFIMDSPKIRGQGLILRYIGLGKYMIHRNTGS